ncbi:MAG: ABC transporter permease subunit [Actinobacteria bacterium]|jgi:arabinogalactan oligomer/maltooligosaccharide transport system permease protein|nr:ABC transporter permease subunit [Micrococcales bacterium]MCB0903907.1 ABC transporter permease subunit [Actinomycetota bacterium]MCO5301205.1 ABC transporter permease subunit [Candidatus Nanopelagicales bacterium]MCB9429574.1 ABC transporter permease subunit [Actinomycetota bacterium]HPE12551.1 ABC transporter permease subunit [Actinomycetota bacterium]
MSTQTPTQDKTKLRAAPRMSFGRWITQLGWRHAITIAAVMFALFPITYIIGVALNPVGSLSSACPPSKTGISALSCLVIPQTVSFENFSAIFNDPRLPYGTWFVNSLTVALVAAIFSTLMSASAAFAFSRLRFKGRRPGLLSLVLLQMFPQILAITAIFILMTKISEVFPQFGSGTVTGLILIYLGGSLGVNTYLIKGFFDTVPIEIDESAKIDGASHVRIFFGLVLRLSAPVMVVVFFVTFTFVFNELAIAQTLLPNTTDTTLAVGMQTYVSGNLQEWGKFAAGALLAAIPMITVFAFTQRYLVTGLTSGAVKG